MANLPVVPLSRGLHVMHLFYRLDRLRWSELPQGASGQALGRLEALCASLAAASHPRLRTYGPVGGKADLGFMLFAAELGQLAQMHRDLEACFPPATLQPFFSFLSVTELTEYMPTDEDHRRQLMEQEKLAPDSAAFQQRLQELRQRRAQYEHDRLYPELPDWEVMAFYPMSKRRQGADNWYLLDLPTRKRLMAGHGRTGRKFSGRVVQLITGSTGLDNWEWGVTLVAHQVDAVKDIVYEMRFDEVSARYADFGPFFVSLRLAPAALWEHLRL